MKDQLIIDSSGAWIRKVPELKAETPFFPPEHTSKLSCDYENSPSGIYETQKNKLKAFLSD